MEIEYKANDTITPEEMQALEESVGFGPYRSLERNQIALAGSLFIGAARSKGQLVGMVRLVGDGAYILHHAGITVHPDFQRQGVGRELMEMAIAFAKQIKIGSGDNFGEFTLFANTGADRFYEEMGFTLAPNGMVLTDTKGRREYEINFQNDWKRKRKERADKSLEKTTGKR
jgi:GNAT superfamily N-acetyltransferase